MAAYLGRLGKDDAGRGSMVMFRVGCRCAMHLHPTAYSATSSICRCNCILSFQEHFCD